MTRSELPFDSAVATGKGDDGTTGLLFGGDRVRKDDLRTEAYGTVDEAVAALGLARSEAAIELPREFTVPGETRLSAALELARTITRRAERRTVTLASTDAVLAKGHILPYLNRLADLLWVLARVAEQAEAHGATVSRPDRGRGSGA